MGKFVGKTTTGATVGSVGVIVGIDTVGTRVGVPVGSKVGQKSGTSKPSCSNVQHPHSKVSLLLSLGSLSSSIHLVSKVILLFLFRLTQIGTSRPTSEPLPLLPLLLLVLPVFPLFPVTISAGQVTVSASQVWAEACETVVDRKAAINAHNIGFIVE